MFPNLKSLSLFGIWEEFIPFIPLFLSPKTTSITLYFQEDNYYRTAIPSVIIALPTFCPSLQRVRLQLKPRDPMTTTAVSGMLLTLNRNTLRKFKVYSALTEEAREVFRDLPNLRALKMHIKGPSSLPTLGLPSLTKLNVEYNHDHGWLEGLRGAALGKLTSVSLQFFPHYNDQVPIGNLLEAFESVALTTSIPATLSEFKFCSQRPWKPNYRSLLPFTQLKKLSLKFDCSPSSHDCSCTPDDDIITDLARAMPKLEVLQIGEFPCWTPTGVTARGLAALARYCPHLSSLRIHFQASSLDPSNFPQVAPGDQSTNPPEGCALTCLDVGRIPLPEDSALKVTRTLLRIFPRLDRIEHNRGKDWEKVVHALNVSRQLTGHLGKKLPLDTSHGNVADDHPQGPHSRTLPNCKIPRIVRFPAGINIYPSSYLSCPIPSSRCLDRQNGITVVPVSQ